jgi:putative two-component system response regulator
VKSGFSMLGFAPAVRGQPEAGLPRILVVDDDAAIRTLLRRTLERAGYSVEEAETAEAALHAIRTSPPDLVFLDLQLPDRTGHSVLEELRSDPATRLLPVVMLTGLATSEQKVRAYELGVTDFVSKPFSPEELLPRVRSLVLLKQFTDEHEHAGTVILMLARTIEARDPYTSGHSTRVAEYADRVAARMDVDEATRIDMRRAAFFHDIGKIVVPDTVLLKPGRLTPEERQVIEKHPAAGAELLSPMKTMLRTLPIVHSHHERLDGSGYPNGLDAGALPLAVRIVTIADIYDALTTGRAYREALSTARAYEILDEGVRDGWWDGSVLRELKAWVAGSRPAESAG